MLVPVPQFCRRIRGLASRPDALSSVDGPRPASLLRLAGPGASPRLLSGSPASQGPIPRFHVITPVVPVASLRALVAEGVDAIQVRDKSADDRALLRFIDDVLGLPVAVIVNDRVDLALAAGAHGVHLGARDLPVAVARELAPDLLISATCRSRDDVLAARAAGASYVGVGPVFASRTKRDLPAPLGVNGLADAVGVLPAVAIGGVTASTVAGLLSVGVHGVAVVEAVSQAPDPPAAARDIASALRAA